MAKQSVLQHNATSGHLDYQTWILKVYIHCEGCKKKVFKVLQSIDGVYKTEIDSKQHKAIVSGSVDGNTLVQKLLKSGKHAEILPESFEPPPPASADNKSENSNQKKKQKNKQKNNDVITEKEEDDNDNDEIIEIDEKKEESETPTAAGKNPEATQPPLAAGDGNGDGNGGGKKKKKNKKKKKEGDKSDGAPEGNGPADSGLKAEESLEGSMEGLDLNRPINNNNQMVYAAPYDLLPQYNNNVNNNYYPTTIPVYGMSYNTSYPSSESSYYTPPVYGYAQSHPLVYYPPQGGPWYYPRSAFDKEEDKQDGRGCNIM